MPYLVALALLLGPAITGCGLGVLAHRARPALRRAGMIVLLVTPWSMLALHDALPLAPWDLVLVGAEIAGGAAWGLSIGRMRRALLVGGAWFFAAACCLELTAAALPDAGPFPPPERAHLWFLPDFYSSGALDALYRDAADRRRAEAETRPIVLHVGDSLLFGEGTAPEERATSVLEAREPSVAQINRGAPGTGPDVHLLVLRRWLGAVHPRLVVHHLFTGNDIEDIDADYGGCGGRPVLDYDAPSPVARCPEPRWHFPLRWLVAHSPPPYPLRVFASVSAAAAHGAMAFTRLGRWTAPVARPSFGATPVSEEKWARFEQVLRAERDELAGRGVPFVVVVLPLRSALEAPDPQATVAYRVRTRMLEVLASLHVRALDPWAHLEAALRRDGSRSIFIDPPSGEIHFNPRGHQLYADWLQEQLGPRLGVSGDAP